jgi:hypothetical protein
VFDGLYVIIVGASNWAALNQRERANKKKGAMQEVLRKVLSLIVDRQKTYQQRELHL